jgi:eukaryotic-like serine/threonine-protein kinase
MRGTTITHYRVLEKIGAGGMGLVYKAEDTRLGRFVALKFLPEEFANDPKTLERFRREARAASALNHPNICTVYDIDEQDGRTFIAMEYLEGETIRDLVRREGALPAGRVVTIALQVVDALQAAHEHGILHRDIKPANIFLTKRGVAKVLDFGLAKISRLEVATDDKTESDTGGWALGTVAYMSPEQALGKTLDQRTDLFSFGAVLYEMATGVSSFQGDTTGEVFLSVVQKAPVSPGTLNPLLPESLRDIINTCLEKNPDDRYQSAPDVLEDLRQVQADSGRPIDQRPSGGVIPAAESTLMSETQRTAANFAKKPWQVFTAIAALVLLAIVGVLALTYRSRATRLGEKDTIVLAEFANTTGESVFDGTLRQALAMDLNQSPFVNVLPPARVAATLKAMNKPASERLTRAVAREVCQRSNSKVYLAGSIAKQGEGYAISVNALNCATDEAVASSEVVAKNRDDAIRMLGECGKQMRRRLGESLPSLAKFNKDLALATTSSLEALQAYSAGLATNDTKGDADALPYYQRAVSLDPNFASAYLRLAISYSNLRQRTKATENYRRAFELRERVSERERFGIESGYLNDTGETARAIQTWVNWSRLYPNDSTPHLRLGRFYMDSGEAQRAAPAFWEAQRLAPNSMVPYTNLAAAYLMLGRFDEAKAVFDAAKTRNLNSVGLRYNRYLLAFAEDDRATMQQIVDSAKDKVGYEDRLVTLEADTQAYYGRIAQSRRLQEQAVAAAVRDGAKDRLPYHKAYAAWRESELENKAQARRLAMRALAASGGRDVKELTALALARTGDVVTAKKVADELDHEYPQDAMVQTYALPTIRALIEMNEGHPAVAIEKLKLALPHEFGYADFGNMEPTYVRGLAYLKIGNASAAAEAFQKLVDNRGKVNNFVTGALAHLQLGRATKMSGKVDEARKHYQDFFGLWKDADPDAAMLKQAKAEYAKLN